MDDRRRFVVGSLAFAIVALVHALLTWPLRSTLALFLGGVAIAFLAEAAGVRLGLLRHAIQPQVAGVPVVVVLAWPATAYVFYRGAVLLVPPGLPAALVAAGAAMVFDLLTDHIGVEQGYWAYPTSPVPGPRIRGVPWWNFVAWFILVFVTAMLPALVSGQ